MSKNRYLNEIDSELILVSSLVKDIEILFPRVELDCLFELFDAISSAYLKICSIFPKEIQFWNEDEITVRVQQLLNDMIGQGKFIGMRVLSFGRNKSVVNFDGSKINKSPDLTVRFDGTGSVSLPFVIEAKIVDNPNKKTAKLYCDEGINRFVVGDYSWYQSESIIIAYVRDGTSNLSSFCEFLTKYYSKSQLSEVGIIGEYDGDLAVSTHQRPNVFIKPLQKPAGPITLWHLWLTCM